MTEERPVLVATEADDITADMVITELNRRDVPVVRFNPADIGKNLTVSARFGTCPVPVVGQVRAPSRTADVTQVRSVYWRRPEWPTFPHLSADDSRFAAAQVRYGLGGTLYALGGPLWVNHPCGLPQPTTNPHSSLSPSNSASPSRPPLSPTTRTRPVRSSTLRVRRSSRRCDGPPTRVTACR